MRPPLLEGLKVTVKAPYTISGAGIDDSTFPPTLLLCLRSLSKIICAKPGDPHWVSVLPAEQYCDDRFGGRCSLGDIMVVDLRPSSPGLIPRRARIVYPLRETALHPWEPVVSYLVRGHDWMLMVCYMSDLGVAPDGGYDPAGSFTLNGKPRRMEVCDVDLAERRPIP